MEFYLDEYEQKELDKWNAEHYPRCTMGGGSDSISPCGAIGGRLTYCFTPTDLGITTVIKCACGEEVNVTNFDEW